MARTPGYSARARNLHRIICSLAWVIFTTSTFAQVSVGQGVSCVSVIQTIKTRWPDVRHHMQPSSGKIMRPESEQFVCLSPYAIRNAMERRIATSGRLKCFTNPGSMGMGICCDDPVTACAQLNPRLFPELLPKRKQEEYQPPKSIWVGPPSEGDQWQTIDE